MASITLTIQTANGAPNTHTVTRTISTPDANRILNAYRQIHTPGQTPPLSDAEIWDIAAPVEMQNIVDKLRSREKQNGHDAVPTPDPITLT